MRRVVKTFGGKSIPVVIVAVLAIASTVIAKYSGGSGTLIDPYIITTPEDLNDIGNYSEDWDNYFKMTDDINLAQYTGTQFRIIGNNTTRFTGVFDGNEHKVLNFTWDSNQAEDIHYVGLFGCVGDTGWIEDLKMESVYVNIEFSGGEIGALAGANYGTIIRCCSTGEVNAPTYGSFANIGGLVGVNYGPAGSVSESYSTSNVSGFSWIGGLAGRSSGTGANIANCYATGSVTGGTITGGLAGQIVNSTISNSYSIGMVSGGGGLLGSNMKGVVTNSFWDVNTSGEPNSAGGTGKTTAQMQTKSTFTDAGWDFVGEIINGVVDIWRMDIDGVDYPKLNWQSRLQNGSGTADDPYRISTAEQLNTIGAHPEYLDKYFILVNDINMADYTSTSFNIIGSPAANFIGIFDGNNRTVLNFSWDSTDRDYIGIFGCIGIGGQVKNLGLECADVNGNNGLRVGGVAARNDGSMEDCYIAGNIKGHQYVGGLVAHNRGTITTSYSAGNVDGNDDAGGLVGFNDTADANIADCYATANVYAVSFAGGLVGYNDNDSAIVRCYATGLVSGNNNVGGLVGYSEDANVIVASFWDAQTTDQSTSSGGAGKTSIEMKKISTFNNANWDFVGTWGIVQNQTYPFLKVGLFTDLDGDAKVDFADLAILASQWLEEI